MPCRSVEADQRNQRHRARGDHPQGFRGAPESRFAGRPVGEKQQPDQRQRQQQPGFHHQSGQRGDRRLFADQAVEAEGQGQHQRHPGQAAELPDLLRHAQRSQGHRQPLQGTQAFLEQQHAEHHVDQRIDVVAQAGFQHVAVVHRPDIGHPVAGDQQSAGGQHDEALRILAQLAPPARVLPEQQQDGAEQGRPDRALDDDFHRGNAFEQFEVEREQSPDHISRQAEDIAPTEVGGRHGESLKRQAGKNGRARYARADDL